jgi:hypothetical protein
MGGMLTEGIMILIIFSSADTCQFLCCWRNDICNQTGHQIGFITICNRKEDIRLFDAGFLQNNRAASGPF